jgi:hypothetical protein
LFCSALPEIGLRMDLLKQLRSGLEARGITVVMATETRVMAPRLCWPAKNAEGCKLITGPLRDSDRVDAHLLIQVSAIASYAAPGPLNNFRRKVGIALAMFNGANARIPWLAGLPLQPRRP